MRILFLDSRVEFLNPTRELLLPLLRNAGEVTPFGPGYVPENALTAGTEVFAKGEGPFDVVVATEHVTNAAFWTHRDDVEAFYRRSHRRHFPISHLRFVPGMLEFALKSEIPKVALALETDYYGLGEMEIHTLLQFNAIVGFGEQFVRPLSDLQRYGSEAFGPLANDNYAAMVRNHADRILSFPHFLSSRELVVRPEAYRRRPKVAVPGASYAARKAARGVLAEAGLLAPGARGLRKAFGALSRIGLPTYSSATGQAILRGAFRFEMSRSALAFTDGSGLEWPVRKFFEIPAMGSALLCVPCNGFEALGFQNGRSAIVTTPESIVEVASQLLSDPHYLRRVQQAGWRVVQASHTVEARGPVVKGALERVVAGTFTGSWWDHGTLTLR
jgi:hypothetical protein